MANTKTYETKNIYAPDTVSCPGETLDEVLGDIGMSQVELAERIGRTPKTINEIIKGKAPITPETALQLERVLKIPASFWNNREREYREALARINESMRLKEHIDWARRFPVAKMIAYGWIDRASSKIEQLEELLAFFGVTSPQSWDAVWSSGDHAVFRRAAAVKADKHSAAAWLRRGQLLAQSIECRPFDAAKFKAALEQIRSLTVEPASVFQPALTKECAACGVAVAFVRELPKIGMSAATYWLGGKPVIQLSLRYKTDDQLWFSFFHEAAHILLHSHKAVFLEGDAATADLVTAVKEREANEFAANLLVPKKHYERFVRGGDYSKNTIISFAADIGVARSIVVGRLQHDGHMPFSRHNDLKITLAWES